MPEWFQLLADARTRLGLSREEVAARAHVSAPSVKSYETGRRHPSRPYLSAILDALKVERVERSEIMEAAGYSSDWRALGSTAHEMGFDLDGVAAEVERVAWPCFVLNEMAEVIAANRVIQRVWGVDLRHEFVDIADRNMLALASTARFADRCSSWDETIGALVAVFKGHHRGPEDLENPSPYFKTVIDRFLQGDPKYISRFLRLWQDMPPRTPELRWHYPVVWQDPDAGVMRFDCVVSAANIPDAWSFNDWIPADAASWAALEKLKTLRR